LIKPIVHTLLITRCDQFVSECHLSDLVDSLIIRANWEMVGSPCAS